MTRLVLKATGGRVLRVHEEGEVGIFLYSWDDTFTFRVGPEAVKDWGARIGDFVTLQIVAGKYEEIASPNIEKPDFQQRATDLWAREMGGTDGSLVRALATELEAVWQEAKVSR